MTVLGIWPYCNDLRRMCLRRADVRINNAGAKLHGLFIEATELAVPQVADSLLLQVGKYQHKPSLLVVRDAHRRQVFTRTRVVLNTQANLLHVVIALSTSRC